MLIMLICYKFNQHKLHLELCKDIFIIYFMIQVFMIQLQTNILFQQL